MKVIGRILLVLMAVLLCSVGHADAHAYVDRSIPADGSELSTSPPEIKIWFTEALEAKFSTLTLVDSQGNPVAGTKQTAPAGSVLALAVPPLPNGVYTVKWHVLAKDTHVTDGTIAFSVGVPLAKGGDATVPGITSPAPTVPSQPSSQPTPTTPAPSPAPAGTTQPAPTPAPVTTPTPAPQPSGTVTTPSTPAPTTTPAPSTAAPSAVQPGAAPAADSGAASTTGGPGATAWVVLAIVLVLAAAGAGLWYRKSRK